MNKLEREENLLLAFSYFDKDGSGFITIDELQQACKEFGLSDVHLDDMISEIDEDNVRYSFLSPILSVEMSINCLCLYVFDKTYLVLFGFYVGWTYRLRGIHSDDEKRQRWNWKADDERADEFRRCSRLVNKCQQPIY